MKNFLTLILINCIAFIALAQAPQKFAYQSVIRNAGNQLVANQSVGIKISILQGTATGSAVYAETHSPLTNANGLASLEIGGGTVLSGNFATINWANGPYFVKTETDLNGGSNYTITNTSQLLSVPFALYAAKAPDQQQLAVSFTGDTLYLQNGGFVNIPGISAANNGGVINNPLSIETALIPAGTFTMGSPNSEPGRNSDEVQHQVTLFAFQMSRYEITNAQYATFLNLKSIGSNGLYEAGTYSDQTLIYQNAGWGLTWTGSQWQPVAGKDNFPVPNVTWYGAAEFATYAGGRLPTEAQWEYACRGGTTTPFNTGNCLDYTEANYWWAYPYIGCTNAVTNAPCFSQVTQEVNSYSPNAFGLYNMHGNLREWCADWYGTYPTVAQNNPTGPSTGEIRVLRGGSCNDAQGCRSAHRTGGNPDSSFNEQVGFRIVFVP
jgi:formylglycine-generating enzyme required for sulfatase activity